MSGAKIEKEAVLVRPVDLDELVVWKGSEPLVAGVVVVEVAIEFLALLKHEEADEA